MTSELSGDTAYDTVTEANSSMEKKLHGLLAVSYTHLSAFCFLLSFLWCRTSFETYVVYCVCLYCSHTIYRTLDS